MSKLKEWLRSKEMERMYSLGSARLSGSAASHRSSAEAHVLLHRLLQWSWPGFGAFGWRNPPCCSYSKCFYQGPNTDTAAYDFRSGTEIRNMAVMLGKMCVPITYKDGGRTINNVQRASMKTPIIGLVNWNTAKGAGGGGGHFVVIDSSDANGNAVICDPWYGLVDCDVSNGGYVAKSKHKAVFSGCWIFTDGKPA